MRGLVFLQCLLELDPGLPLILWEVIQSLGASVSP
jgi:hypothetical protein